MFPFSGEGRETPTLLGPLDRAGLNHCDRLVLSKEPKRLGTSLPSPEDGDTTSVLNIVCFWICRMDKSTNPLILNPLKCLCALYRFSPY
jgi:hypothetical protein